MEPAAATATPTRVRDGALVDKPQSRSNGIWLFILGFLNGIFATLTVTILIGWIINTSVPHSNWLNKAFYGYALGCGTA